MRNGRILTLIVASTVAIVAAWSSGQAIAATTLCKESSDPIACPAGERYPQGTEFKAALRIGEAKLEAGSNTTTCGTSIAIFKTKAAVGAPLGAEVTEFFFGGGCTGCSQMVAIHTNYSAELERTSPANGSLTFKNGGEGDPALKISGCTGGISCIYKAEALSTFLLGGEMAEYAFSNAPMAKESGGCAATEAKFNAVYRINFIKEPGGMWVMSLPAWVEKT